MGILRLFVVYNRRVLYSFRMTVLKHQKPCSLSCVCSSQINLEYYDRFKNSSKKLYIFSTKLILLKLILLNVRGQIMKHIKYFLSIILKNSNNVILINVASRKNNIFKILNFFLRIITKKSVYRLNSRVVQSLNAIRIAGSNQSIGWESFEVPGIRSRGKRALGMPTGGGALVYAVRAVQPRSLVISRRLHGASTLITYPYTRIPTVCLPTDGSNE